MFTMAYRWSRKSKKALRSNRRSARCTALLARLGQAWDRGEGGCERENSPVIITSESHKSEKHSENETSHRVLEHNFGAVIITRLLFHNSKLLK